MTEAGSALDGVHEYLPESDNRTWRSRRDVDVTGFVLSVRMATPPRAESCLSSLFVTKRAALKNKEREYAEFPTEFPAAGLV